MRFITRGIVTLSMMSLPAVWSKAQSDPGPLFASPPTAAVAPTSEATSQPWSPPPAFPAPSGSAIAPDAELPLPGAGDPGAAAAIVDPATKGFLENSPGPWRMPQGWFGPA